MRKILICAGSEKTAAALSALLKSIDNTETAAVFNGKTVQRFLAAHPETNLVVFNTPLEDEQGLSLAVSIVSEYSVPVLAVTDEESFGRVGGTLTEHGVVVFRRPVDKRIFCNTVETLLTADVIMKHLRGEAAGLQENLEELRMVNKAKALLIQNLHMTEAQAHRYIEKQAMDLRQSRKIIAQNILKTYFNK